MLDYRLVTPINYNYRGVTLVELVVTIIIMGLLATLAIPSFTDALKRYESRTVIRVLAPMLSEARHHALTRHQHVVVCPTQDGMSCVRDSHRFMSFIDVNANQTRDSADILLKNLKLDLRYGTLKFNLGLRRRYIRFYPDTGKPRGHFGNITYCPNDFNMTYAHAVIFNEHGRIRQASDHNGDGLKEHSRGRSLRCS